MDYYITDGLYGAMNCLVSALKCIVGGLRTSYMSIRGAAWGYMGDVQWGKPALWVVVMMLLACTLQGTDTFTQSCFRGWK